MNIDALMTSKSNEWETPKELFEKLDREFHFTLDPCANKDNAKCKKYYTVQENGLTKDWQGETVFCNPPYGRAISDWVKKCHDESLKPNTRVVMLIPARTDTKYFHQYIYHSATIRFLEGRLKFSNSKNSAPFTSMIVIYDYYKGED